AFHHLSPRDAYHLAQMAHLKPVLLNINHTFAEPEDHRLYMFTGEENVPITVERKEASLPTQIVLSQNNNVNEAAWPTFSSIEDIIALFSVPNLFEQLGPFTRIEKPLAAELSQDFRLNREKLDLTPNLFCGALIGLRRQCLVVLTVEIYSRATSMGVHAEASGATLPPELSKFVIKVVETA
ncbi:hypothetical protein MBANPS3_002719, partial [Mucor bainieri]